MKLSIFLLVFLLAFSVDAQVDLSTFKMSNNASPAFMLVEESPTIIYVPDNLRALSIYAMDNLGKSLSIELNPYFFINPDKKGRSFYKYIGVDNVSDASIRKQHPFSGLNTTTVSFAFIDKEFKGIIVGKKKTYSIGLRTTILRFFDKKYVFDNANNLATALSNLEPPYADGDVAAYFAAHKVKLAKLQSILQKTIKPLFRLDGAVAYSALFKENTTNSDTVSRFGSWLTAQGSIIINEGSESKFNNYFNVLLTARYIDDGFNSTVATTFFNLHYLDFGGKIALDYNNFTFGYEFISRNGSVNSSRSVGSIAFSISKDITISGGFGKDFSTTNDNLLTVFGINWGLNFGKKSFSL